VASRSVNEFHLDFLNLCQSLPLVRQKIDLLVKMRDLRFGFEVHLIIVHRMQAVSGFLADLAASLDHALPSACLPGT
jgi:hypothetical protein